MPGLPGNGAAVKAAYQRYIPFARSAGFSGDALIKIMAIAFAESGLNPSIDSKPNLDGSIDRGILQINNRAHPEVTDACAHDAACSFQAGWKISNGGTNFHPWSTFNNNVPGYQTGLKDMQAIQGGGVISDPNQSASTGSAAEPTGNLPKVVSDATSSLLAPFLAVLPGYGIKIGVFMGALMLVIVGFWIVSNQGGAK